MDNTHSIAISVRDFVRLYDIVADTAFTSRDSRGGQIELLNDELSRATIFPIEEMPDDVVKMNSAVEYEDLDTGKVSKVTVVYPEYADVDSNKVSVLAPIGSALIGLKVGQSISWPMPNGKVKLIRVMSVENPNKRSELS